MEDECLGQNSVNRLDRTFSLHVSFRSLDITHLCGQIGARTDPSAKNGLTLVRLDCGKGG